MIRKEAWSFYRTISGVRLCWELKEPKGPKKGQRGSKHTTVTPRDSPWTRLHTVAIQHRFHVLYTINKDVEDVDHAGNLDDREVAVARASALMVPHGQNRGLRIEGRGFPMVWGFEFRGSRLGLRVVCPAYLMISSCLSCGGGGGYGPEGQKISTLNPDPPPTSPPPQGKQLKIIRDMADAATVDAPGDVGPIWVRTLKNAL